MNAMKKGHRVAVHVMFNRTCSPAEAVAAVKDIVHGTFFPTPTRDGGPDAFRVRSVRKAPAKPSLPPHLLEDLNADVSDALDHLVAGRTGEARTVLKAMADAIRSGLSPGV
jgi:hypothetical protein